ncbi:zinc-ribbon domain-containing protein [Serratia sp. L9]|uniref:zinc-ribbon domain-containing protein n=1 Tax=Serratia sp. L9 TaxID=3423946 RepID=UPI003D67ACA2
MALIDCKECHREISDSAKSCPHCGMKLQKPIGNVKGCFGVVLLFGSLFFCFILVSAIFGDAKHTPLDLCKMMIKMDSANPDNVQIADIDGRRQGDKISYEWTPSH